MGKKLDENGGGAGLGLSIAREVVDAYGGAMRLSRNDLGGLSLDTSVPRTKPN